MGCDIHIRTEAKFFKKGVCTPWVNVDAYIPTLAEDGHSTWVQEDGLLEIWNGRDYDLFGVLAGVRGDGCVIQPRGFPNDASPKTKADYSVFGEDAHTPTWLTLNDLKRISHEAPIAKELYRQLKYRARNLWIDDPIDIRIVIWFDS